MTITIPLTKGYTAIVDDEDADLAAFKWTAHVRSNGVYAKRVVLIDRRSYTVYLHRVIAERIVGRPLLSSERADHEYHDPLNNRRSNIRLATPQQNAMNRRINSNNRSGYKGVRWVKDHNAWAARIMVDGRSIFLGYFDTAEKAHWAHVDAAIQHHGAFACDGVTSLSHRAADAPVATRQLPLFGFDGEAA